MSIVLIVRLKLGLGKAVKRILDGVDIISLQTWRERGEEFKNRKQVMKKKGKQTRMSSRNNFQWSTCLGARTVV